MVTSAVGTPVTSGFARESKLVFSILRWWTGDPNREDHYFKDAEMYAQLWGEWDGYLIGSLVITDNGGLVEKDWSRGGWLDYFYPRGK